MDGGFAKAQGTRDEIERIDIVEKQSIGINNNNRRDMHLAAIQQYRARMQQTLNERRTYVFDPAGNRECPSTLAAKS